MHLDTGDTAWLLASAAAVLLMTPGLAFFYGGMVRSKNVLGMLMQNFFCIAIVSVLWVLVGYSIAFGGADGFWGGLHFAGLAHLDAPVPGGIAATVPQPVFVAFQLTFAIITVALITGSAADRWRFGGFIAFTGAWSLLVYAPVAHWVFSPAGWLYHRGVEDFAGGTVVEANAGIAGLAVAIVLGRRHGWPGANFRPHNLPLVMIGTGLLWFGWFGFNAGSAYGANRLAAYAFLNTNTAGAAAVITWLIVEKRRDGHPTTLGAASGAVAGLVAITPSCGYVTPMGALAIGAVAGMACAFATPLKLRLRFDDSLDVVAVHFVGGIVGTLAVGVLGDSHISGRDGLLRGGGFGLLGNQALALGATIVYSGIVTALIAWVIHRVRPMRLSPEEQQEGMDAVLHSETAYENSALPAMLGFGSQLHSAGTNPVNRGAQEVR